MLHHEAWGASRTACRPLVGSGPCDSWVCSDLILSVIKYSKLQTFWEALKSGFSTCWWEGRAGRSLHLWGEAWLYRGLRDVPKGLTSDFRGKMGDGRRRTQAGSQDMSKGDGIAARFPAGQVDGVVIARLREQTTD